MVPLPRVKWEHNKRKNDETVKGRWRDFKKDCGRLITISIPKRFLLGNWKKNFPKRRLRPSLFCLVTFGISWKSIEKAIKASGYLFDFDFWLIIKWLKVSFKFLKTMLQMNNLTTFLFSCSVCKREQNRISRVCFMFCVIFLTCNDAKTDYVKKFSF